MSKKSKKERQSLKHIWNNTVFMLRYAFRYLPAYSIWLIIIQVLFGINDIFWGVLLMKIAVDAVTVTQSYTDLLWIAGGYIVYCGALQAVAGFFFESYGPARLQRLGEKMQTQLFEKAVGLDYSCYSNPEFYNDFVWAASQAEMQVSAVLNNTALFLKSIAGLSAVVTAMLTMDAVGVVFIVASFAGVFLLSLLRNKVQFKRDVDSKPLERKRAYINRVFYLADYAKEMRLHPLKGSLDQQFAEANREMKQVVRRYAGKLAGLSFLSEFVFSDLLIDGIYMIFLAYRVIVQKSLTYGTLAGMLNGAWTLKMNLNNIAQTIGDFQRLSLYTDKFRGFLDYKNQMQDAEQALPAPNQTALLECRNVSFTYPGCDAPTLRDINLSIRPGEKVAIVGYNGAGKSTLVKLLTRLYDPTQGQVCYDAKNIRDYRLRDYRDCFGTAFQDYRMFAATLAENVVMDRAQGREKEAQTALEKAGFSEKLRSLPQGLDTPLTREFSDKGLVLSGGEAQKVAIARVFAGNPQVLILDEPSSALDPLSEYHVNHSMLEAAGNKTVIFISHRLSTTKAADVIYMMEHGKIIEQGSHEELMAKGGKYAEMFRLQSKNYSLVAGGEKV